MLGKHQGLGRAAGVLALGLSAGCSSGTEVPAGAESDAVNLSRCYGADCGVHALSLGSAEVDAQPCEDSAGELDAPLLFDEIAPGAEVVRALEAADGSVWALESLRAPAPATDQTLYLGRFSADGALLASQELRVDARHAFIDAALAVDTTGDVTVGIYSSFAEDADSEVIEELELSSFDSGLAPLGAARRFRGVASPQLFGGPAGGVWLAGNAEANAPHGVISRITQREPDWIQTRVPSSGQGVIGISGLTVADDGTAAVVAGWTPKWSGEGPDTLELGLATFDASGKPLWTLALPTAYRPGYMGALGGTARGDLVVSGMLESKILVRQISREGKLGAAYSFDAPNPEVKVGRDSGRAFVRTTRGLAVIEADGARCRQFSMGTSDAEDTVAAPWQANAEYLLSEGGPLARYRVPE